ncbi:hypothetical protein AV656_08555 [Bhargavaea cecembensis]|uniref:Uncharacterized protein n=1 Tax=Bhargavaea cecembensis TaxID=394098 RepID=A0A161STH4_9BACL|nr:hypothetical protein [Bhargavaea cecembensis]KZE38940.1 hypothetical protein AV656_08555 [Bhargavaea cecembensis]
MPNIEDVIKVQEEVSALSNAPLAIIAGAIWIFITVAFIVFLFREKKAFSLKGWIYSFSFLVILFAVTGYLTYTIKEYNFSMNEEKWEENYLKRYLESLPEKRENIEDFSQVLNDENTIKSIYMNKDTQPIVVEISKSQDIDSIQKKIRLQAIVQKEQIDKPYITYKTIEKDISDKYTKDQYYETVLHIPSDYKVIVPSK